MSKRQKIRCLFGITTTILIVSFYSYITALVLEKFLK